MTDTGQPTSMQQAMEKAESDLSARESKAESAVDDKEPSAKVPSDPNEWADEPKYFVRWKEGARNAMRAYATDPKNAESWKHVREQLDNFHSFLGRSTDALGHYQKRFDPINDLLSSAEKQYAMWGMDLQGGLRQQMAVANALETNPDATLPWLASLYKPKDAGAVIKAIAQASGLDLNQLVQSAPYVDPAISQMVNPLMQEIQALKQANWNSQQQATYQQQSAVINHLRSFESAADANGNRLHPYIDDPEVKQMMIFAMNSGAVQRDLAAAYAWACERHLPAIQAKAKAADAAALTEAARTTHNSQQAKQASNNLNSSAAKGRVGNDKPSLREAMQMADKQLGLPSPTA